MTPLTPEELRAIDIAAEALQRVARARGARWIELAVETTGRVDLWLGVGAAVEPIHATADLLVGGPDPMPSVAVAALAKGAT